MPAQDEKLTELSPNCYLIFYTNVFPCFVYIVIIKTQNSTLSCVSSELPGPGATFLGWPKSIYININFTTPLFTISQSQAVSTILISCDVSDLIWLQYQGRLAGIGCHKYIIIPFSACFGSILGLFGVAMNILA